MRWNVWMVLALTMWMAFPHLAPAQGPAGVNGQPPRGAAAPRAAAPPTRRPIDPNGQRMMQLLAQWANRSSQLESLRVHIRRIDKSAAWGDEEYQGEAIFKRPNRARLEFEKFDRARKGFVPHEQILCTGTEVWQYRFDTRQVFIHRLDRRAQETALQEGPLPFLFNLRAEEAGRRYRMTLIGQDAKAFVVEILPLLKIDQEAFSKAWIQLDATSFLPSQIILFDPGGKNQKRFIMSNTARNADVADVEFVGKRMGAGWTTHVNEAEAAAPPQAAGRTGQVDPTRPTSPLTRPRSR